MLRIVRLTQWPSLPKSLIDIGEGVFEDCGSLKSIYVPNGSKERFVHLLSNLKDKIIESSDNKAKDLDKQTETEVIKLRTKCDITEASHARVNGFLKAMYSVFVPFCPKCESIIINRGDLFRAWMYGLLVKGKVEGVFPSTLGGFVCYVQADEIANQN